MPKRTLLVNLAKPLITSLNLKKAQPTIPSERKPSKDARALDRLQFSRVKATIRNTISKVGSICTGITYESRTHGVHTLPPELLILIFRLHYVDNASEESPFSVDKWHLIMTLCQVCRRWRYVAQSMQTLWNHIPIRDLGDPKTTRSAYLKCLGAILRVPKDIPLHISITGICYRSSHPAIQLLLQHSERWETLRLNEVSPEIFCLLLGAKGRMTRLQRISISGTINLFNGFPFDLWLGLYQTYDIFWDTPSLQTVSISSLPCTVALPQSQHIIFRLESSIVSDWNIRALSDYSPNLTSLRLVVHSGIYVLHDLAFPRLEELSITFFRTCNQLNEFFDNIYAPSLHIVFLKITSKIRDLSPLACNMIQRSNAMHIHTITILQTSPPRDISTLISFTPHLLRLTTPLPSLVDIISLASTRGPHFLVPFLRECTFHINTNHLSTDIIGAINLLADNRCNKYPAPYPLDSSPSNLHLERFTIISAKVLFRHRIRCKLQGWTESDPDRRLANVAAQMLRCYPILDQPSLKESKWPIDRLSREYVTFGMIVDTLSISVFKVDNIGMLLGSDILRYMVNALDLFAEYKADSVYQGIKRLLMKWRMIIIRDRSSLRWIFRTRYCLEYFVNGSDVVYSDSNQTWSNTEDDLEVIRALILIYA